MKVVTHLDQIPKVKGPIAFTIGIYDGIHLGHQFLFKQLHKYTRKEGTNVILTFSNHPTTLLSPEKPTFFIMPLEHRLHLLKSYGFDLAIVLPFDQTLANLSYDTFLQNLHAQLPFNHLILGSDARFGKNRAGDPLLVQKLGTLLHFHSEYLPKETYHKEPISSDCIRKCLTQGDLKKAKKLLGRPYSIRIPFKQPIQENEIQYRLDLKIEGLCILPSAVYAVDIGKVPSIAFYRSTQDINGYPQLSMTLYFEQKLSRESYLTLNFISYLHNELDPKLSTSATLLETLNLQTSLS